MKASKARSVAVEAQYTRITKKIESECKDGRENYEYKHGTLFDEVVMKLIEDGYFVVRDYTKRSAIISWFDEIDVESDHVPLRCIMPHYDEEGNESKDLVYVLDFYAPLEEIPTFDMVVEYLYRALESEEDCCEEDGAEELEGAVTTEPETIEPEVIETEPTESEALESENIEIEILPEVEAISEPVVEVVPEVVSTSEPTFENVADGEEPVKE